MQIVTSISNEISLAGVQSLYFKNSFNSANAEIGQATIWGMQYKSATKDLLL